ncbi:NEW3 domain-containing protein [Vibrio sp. ABG19]|uniref:NEW3 domain-containing protein n=1 Tax=Vibrio sp. ABG19 TaxID=2817385 RepID=UPI00249E69EA|nr:NEW3 domain-containing protein [Vibrio sp. ABG19]WGY45281.1 cadherin-like domain-containing protein [Vibrio sp. ABG19]
MFNLHFNFRDDAVRSSKQASALLLSAFSLLFIVPFASASQVHQDHGASHNHYEDLSGQNYGQQIAQQNRLQAKAETQALVDSLNTYRSADKADKKSALNQMVSLAKQRKDYFKQLMESDPAAVAGAVLTAAERQQMPDAVSQYLEQKKTLDGELEVFYEDYEDHSKSRLRHILKTANGRIELHMAEKSAVQSFSSGEKVRAHGWRFDNSEESTNSLVLENDPEALALLAQDGTSTTGSSASTDTFGEQRTLVMLINFQDNIQEPWTAQETQDLVFGPVSDYYKENSDGRTWLTGDVVGYYTLPIASTCDSWDIYVNAKQMAEDSGVDVSRYQRLVYIFPKNSSCGWTGMGTLGGTQTRAYINGSFTMNTIGHELGHNFGLYHAEYLDCKNEIIGEGCLAITYGDTLDIMGAYGVEGHFNAFNKEQLGWLSTDSGDIVEADTEASYIIEPLETTLSDSAKGIKIPRGIDPETGQQQWYYVEYRQAIGFDSFLSNKPGVTNGVVIHRSPESSTRGSQLLDMTPQSSLFDLDDAALLTGNSFTDSDAGITITTEWADSTGASVHVSFTQATCSSSSPGVSVVANQSSVLAGDTASYSVTVVNNDSDSCAATNYNVSAEVPDGWLSTSSVVSLAAGATETVTLNVTPSDKVAEGSYSLSFAAVNGSDSRDIGSAVANLTIDAPVEQCVPGNPVLSLTASQTRAVAAGTTVSYTATVTNKDSMSCESSTVDVVANVPNGWTADSRSVALAPGQSASVNLSVTSSDTASEGVYPVDVYTYNTADIAYNSSAESSYIVAAPEALCVEAAPRISVASVSGEVTAGSTVTYNVTVTNQNSTDCEATSYSVSAQVPSGWSSTHGIISLASGQSSTMQIAVTSATHAADGTYNIAVLAQSATDSSVVSKSSLSYVVVNSVNNAPVAVYDSVLLLAKDPTLINVLGNDSDPDGDTLRISGVTQGAKGSVDITASGQLLYTPAKNFKGSDSFTYTITDGEKTATATVSIGMDSSTSSNSGPSNNSGKGKK